MELLTSAVFCFVRGNLIDSEAAVSRLLLPSNSSRLSHCEGQETTNDLSDLLSLDLTQQRSVLHDVLSSFGQ